MSRWFRHYAGMMRDEKLVGVALRSKQSVERVLWVWGAILENAAEINDGGRFEVESAEIAYFLRTDEADVLRITHSLEEMGRINANAVVNWGDRQFQSDLSAERQRRHREKRGRAAKNDDHSEATPSRDASITSPSRHRDAPETETETETEKKDSSLRSLDDWPDDFREAFWAIYPRKSGKQAAIRELERVRKRKIPWQKLMSAVAAYAATADPKFTKHPKTWLSHGCWDDEPDTRKPHGTNRSAIISAADRLVAGGVAFGPKPSLMPGADGGGAGAPVVRLLPDGRGERPGNVHGGHHIDSVRILDGGGSARDGPEDGDCAQDQVPAVNPRG